jgi:hypothetical protein
MRQLVPIEKSLELSFSPMLAVTARLCRRPTSARIPTFRASGGGARISGGGAHLRRS